MDSLERSLATIPLHAQIGDKDKTIKVSSATTELWPGLAEEELEAETLAR